MKKLSLFLIALTMLLVSCKPEVEKPTVVTKSVGDVSKTSVKVVGQVAADGGAEIIERGVCWSTDGMPTILDFSVKDTNGGLGSYEILLTDLIPNTQYYVRAYATNESGTGYGNEKTFTLQPTEGTSNGHVWVDLGLPSGKKWANCNVGATTPKEYGVYYAWGETITKSNFSQSNSLTNGLSISELQAKGYIDSNLTLTSQYDAATANWGGNWRMPTRAEYNELLDNCTWTRITQNEVEGYNVKGPNGSNIFFPSIGNIEQYWSSTAAVDYNYACLLFFEGDDYGMSSNFNRYLGCFVRPILD